MMLRKTITLVKLVSGLAAALILVFLLLSGGCQGPETEANRPPEIIKGIALPTGTVKAGEKISVRVVSVSDPDGDTVVYIWRADSGRIEPSGPSENPVAIYTAPSLPGEYTITVVVSDGKGGTTTDSIRFNVVAVPMVIPTPTLHIEITEPYNEATVPREIVVRGTFGELPLGSTIWTVVYIDGLYWPQRQADQFLIGNVPTWQSSVWIGGEKDSGKEFDVLAVLADEVTDDLFMEWLRKGEITGEYPGLLALPVETRIYDKVTVIRQ